jgi:hypothetical protein
VHEPASSRLANVSGFYFLVPAQAMSSAAATAVGRAIQSNTPARLSHRPSATRHLPKVINSASGIAFLPANPGVRRLTPRSS